MEEVKKEECFAEFSGELKQAQEGREEYSDDWESTAKVVRETAQKLARVSSEHKKEDKEMVVMHHLLGREMKLERMCSRLE